MSIPRQSFQIRLDLLFILPVFLLVALGWQRALRSPDGWRIQDEIAGAFFPAIFAGTIAAIVIGVRNIIVERRDSASPQRRSRAFRVALLSLLLSVFFGFVELVAVEIEMRGYRSYSPNLIHPQIVEDLWPFTIFLLFVGCISFILGGIVFGIGEGVRWLFVTSATSPPSPSNTPKTPPPTQT